MCADYVNEDVLARLDTIIQKLTSIEALLQPAAPVSKSDPVMEVERAQTAADLLQLMRKR